MELTVKFLCALVFFLVTFYFSEVLVQAPSLDDKYCPPGKYSAKTGVCCNMCTAGKFVISECTSSGEDSVCGSCVEGETFTEEHNHLADCHDCSSCSDGEEEVLPCKSTRNTVCQCKEGYYRSTYSEKCEKTMPGPGWMVVGLIITLILIIISLILLLCYFYRKWRGKVSNGRDYTGVSLIDELFYDGHWTSRQKLIYRNRKMLQSCIGKNPQHLLDELDIQGTISHSVYREVQCTRTVSDRAANLIQHFLNDGETACQNLLDGLHATGDKYPGLADWLVSLERKSIVVVEGRNMRLVRRNKLNLKLWISDDPDSLLEELERKLIIRKEVSDEAKNQRNSLEATGFLLDHIVSCGEERCREFLDVLKTILRYPKVNKWMSILEMKADLYREENSLHQVEKARIVVVDGNALYMIRGKKPELKKWIGSTSSSVTLLDKLKTRRHISEHVHSKAAGMVTTDQAGFLLDHFIDGGERKCHSLLETLQELREHYPQVDKWLDSLENNSQIVVVKEGTREIITRSHDDLKQWIAKDPWVLLDELDSKWYIQRHVYNTARDIKDKGECAAFILEHFISGDEEYQKLLVALKAVHRHYDDALRTWLSSLGLTRETNSTNPPEKKIVVVPGNAEHVIRGNKPDLKKWVASSSSTLLDELTRRGHIAGHVYSKATRMAAMEQAGFLLDHFIDGGERKCQKLLETLQELKDKFPEIKQWLSSLENKAAIVIVEEGTRERIITSREDLKKWITKDPWVLLDELDSKWYIQRHVYNTARDIKDKGECAAFILEHFISGEEEFQKLLVALKAVQKQYDQGLRKWLKALGLPFSPGSPISHDEPLANPASCYHEPAFHF
ncbi:uncharacterized protein LOC133348681 isoform X1 [Lethenteron reissneri]|uniref:uncharacterized protein LOC133348681 isoform X1 n=2 Tax=Lethenteron reissneri TaxID=7753 RepID=UPI002AB78785|nr:uncharacterized protein LOC133348681 isoform X1 [Lethenteron reissneri]